MTDATKLDEAAARARCEAATEGPWEVGDLGGNVVFVVEGGQIITGYEDGDGWVDVREADAEFIAHARTDIPMLLAAHDEARKEVEQWKAMHQASAQSARDFWARAEAAESALASIRTLARSWSGRHDLLMTGDSAAHDIEAALATPTTTERSE